MVQFRIPPHRQASTGSVQWGAWWYVVNGQRHLAEGLVEGWDYSTPITFEVQPSVDEDRFLESTGLPSVRVADFVAIVECPSTGIRHISRIGLAQLFSEATKSLCLAPDPATLSGSILLSASVVLNRDLPSAIATVASRAGARLASSGSTRLLLEGDGARFPTEAVDFKELGYEPAPWSVECDFSDPHEMFLGSVRLMVNTKHPSAETLLGDGTPNAALVQSVLRTDILRQLFAAASDVMDEFRTSEFSAGSLGYALENLSDLYFGRSAYETLRLRQMDAQQFELLLMSRTQMLEETV